MKFKNSSTWALVGLLVAIGVFSRLIKDYCPLLPPNFHAIVGTTLFAGYLFRNSALALIVPVASMLISDFVLGGYEALVMATVYGSLAAPVVARGWLRQRLTPSRVVLVSLVSSVLFFATTNLAVWYTWYPHTLAGVARCYTAALPFFSYTLSGDLLFALTLFGLYAWAMRRSEEPQAEAALALAA